MSAPVTPPEEPRAARRAALRRATLHLVAGVLVLDAVALGVYYLAGIGHGPERTRTIFVVTWTLATALVVAVLLKRVRAARYMTRR
jgi:tellurite resistance protein TehA-like permease